MKKSQLVDGELIEVTDSLGINCPCIILFQSRVFKDVILLGIMETIVNEQQFDSAMPRLLSLVYTSSLPITKGRWRRMNTRIDLPHCVPFSLNVAADSVWLGDKEIRSVVPTDRATIPQMSVAGMMLVEEFVAYARTGAPVSKFATRTHATAQKFLKRLKEKSIQLD